MCAGVPAALCGRGDGGAGGRTDRVSAPQGAGSFCCCSWAHTPGLAWSSPLSGPHENHLPGAPSQHLTALVESHQELMLAACQPGLCLFLAREEVQGCLLCYAQSTCQRDHRESGSLCHVRAAAVPLSAAVRGLPAVSWWPRWDHGAAVTACVPRMALSVTAEQTSYPAHAQIPCLGSESACRDLPVSPRACGFLLCSITVSSWNRWK